MAVQTPYTPLFSPQIFPHLSLVLVGLGLLAMGWFFTLQVSSGRSKSNGSSGLGCFVKELIVAAIGSGILGFGLLFLALNVGINV